MSVTHTNRKGTTYYLTRRTGKNGRTYYAFTKELHGEPVERIPDGYQVFEIPSTGQVVLRKRVESLVPDEDYQLLERYMAGHFESHQYILERKQREIVVHFTDEPVEAVDGISAALGMPSGPAASELRTLWQKYQTYLGLLRFVYNEKDRTYRVERFCFAGGVDDWLYLDSSPSIEPLVSEYCPHLGKDSFYELM
jgi:hypothetical protein